MSIVTLPASLATPAAVTIGQQRYDLTESSDSTGSEAARLLAPPRWSASVRSVDALTLVDGGLWEATLVKLRGRVNHLALHDPARPVPEGTLRGSPTLDATAAAGATTLTLAAVRNARNLLTYPRAFDNAAWSKVNGCTVSANSTAAPDGSGTHADTITDPNAAASAVARQTVSVPDDTATYTGSIHLAKTVGGTSPTVLVQIALTGGSVVSQNLRVDTDAGTILSGTGNIVAVGSSWWRVDGSVTNDASGNTSLRLDVFPAINAHGLTGTDVAITGSCVAWGAQLELGASVTDFEGATLLPGDWLQIGSGVGSSQLVKVVAAAAEASDGTMAVTFEPPLRAQYVSTTAVTWERALGYYKQTSAPQWSYRPGGRYKAGPYAIDLLESWA